MYKLIVSDLDETLLNNSHEICDKNIEMINLASKMGIKFIPATGRGFGEISNILKTLDLYDKENEYVISYNGCALTENKSSRIMSFDGLPFDKANELYKFGITKDVCIHVYTKEMRYVYNLNDWEKQRFINQGTPYQEINEQSLEFLRDTEIAKVIYQNLDVPYLKKLSEEMTEMTDNAVSVSFSSNCYMELNKIGVNKGDAVLNLAKLLEVNPQEVIVVGDNYNDVSMLKIAGLSVAAGNAVQDVKDMCHYVCKNDNNDGVLAEVIEKFILKK